MTIDKIHICRVLLYEFKKMHQVLDDWKQADKNKFAGDNYHESSN